MLLCVIPRARCYWAKRRLMALGKIWRFAIKREVHIGKSLGFEACANWTKRIGGAAPDNRLQLMKAHKSGEEPKIWKPPTPQTPRTLLPNWAHRGQTQVFLPGFMRLEATLVYIFSGVYSKAPSKVR